jgi:hypothetical protein
LRAIACKRYNSLVNSIDICVAEPTMTFTTHNPPNRMRDTAIFAAAGAGMCVGVVGVGQSLYTRRSKTGVGSTQ